FVSGRSDRARQGGGRARGCRDRGRARARGADLFSYARNRRRAPPDGGCAGRRPADRRGGDAPDRRDLEAARRGRDVKAYRMTRPRVAPQLVDVELGDPGPGEVLVKIGAVVTPNG